MSKTKVKWRLYPQEKPKKEDMYLVSIKSYEKSFTSASYWDNTIYTFLDFDDCMVMAWAKLPKPYKEENNE